MVALRWRQFTAMQIGLLQIKSHLEGPNHQLIKLYTVIVSLRIMKWSKVLRTPSGKKDLTHHSKSKKDQVAFPRCTIHQPKLALIQQLSRRLSSLMKKLIRGLLQRIVMLISLLNPILLYCLSQKKNCQSIILRKRNT